MSAEKVQSPKVRMQWEIPPVTFIKIIFVTVLCLALVKMIPVFFILFIAILLATTMVPVVKWLNQKGIPKTLANVLVAATAVGFIAFVGVILIPEVISQVSGLFARLPELQKSLEKSIPSDLIRNRIQGTMEHPEAMLGKMSERLTAIGSATLMGIYDFVLMMIFAIYFMWDGERTYEWIVAFFKPLTQHKIRQTAGELQPVVFAYVSGQMITSVLVGIYVFVSHHLLHVPGALMLGVVASICDILPVLGFILSLSISAVMALTVSPGTALIVVGLHIGYMILENNLIVPFVYGNRMKISGLAVLTSIIAGEQLAGIPGMLLVLPIVAAYPIVEKIWLRKYLGNQTVETHEQMVEATEPKE